MIGKLADAFNRMFATEKAQEQHSGNQVSRDDKLNTDAFEKNIVANSQKIAEVKDTYQSKRYKEDEDEDENQQGKDKDKKKDKKKKPLFKKKHKIDKKA